MVPCVSSSSVKSILEHVLIFFVYILNSLAENYVTEGECPLLVSSRSFLWVQESLSQFWKEPTLWPPAMCYLPNSIGSRTSLFLIFGYAHREFPFVPLLVRNYPKGVIIHVNIRGKFMCFSGRSASSPTSLLL